jgi:hypothetical protein
MDYNTKVVGVALVTAATCYSMNPDQHITGSSLGLYHFEAPVVHIAAHGNYSLDSHEASKVEKPRRDIAAEFAELAGKWKEETGFHSSLSEKFMHPAYQRIMAMGEHALPLILRDLQQNSAHWFYALRFIVDDDIAVGTKTVSEARAAWVQWGYEHGYI